MFHNRFYVHCLICGCILVFGLGLALVLPWLANAQGLAAQSEAVVKSNTPDAPTRYYVAKTGDGTAPSVGWSTAFTNVQHALAAAAESGAREIWVAAGVYYTDKGLGQTDNDPSSTFELEADVALYGGFDTADTKLSDRDWETNLTVLSGDLYQDDTSSTDGVVMNTTDIERFNAYHVVWADGAKVTEYTVIDGFTITAGKADGETLPHQAHGGGFYCKSSGNVSECSPSLRNIVFSGNQASSKGGAMYNSGPSNGTSSPSLTNVSFSFNSAQYGGAMYNDGHENGASSPILTNVIFSDNWAVVEGGAMYNDGHENGTSSPSLTNVSFSSNSAQIGGAMHNDGRTDGESSPILSNVFFSGNSANQGGAMYNNGVYGDSSPRLTNVTFSGNSATNWFGGAMYNIGVDVGTSSPILTNVSFSGNSAQKGGGAIFNSGYKGGTSSPRLTNVTFSGNSAGEEGGAMFNVENEGICIPQIRNSILWDNLDSSGKGTITANITNMTATVTISNSLVQASGGSAGWSLDASYEDGGGNIDVNPKFVTPVDPSSAPTTAGDLHLKSSSPAIDAGDNTYVSVTFDLDNFPRITDGDGDFVETVDMGAYEFPPYDYLELFIPLILR